MKDLSILEVRMVFMKSNKVSYTICPRCKGINRHDSNYDRRICESCTKELFPYMVLKNRVCDSSGCVCKRRVIKK